VDNGRVLRTLFQMLRSGQFGRKSLSYALQRAFQDWFNSARAGTLLSASIGNHPSLRDVLRLARPTPADNARRALFGFLTGRPAQAWAPAAAEDLPAEAVALVAFRQAQTEDEQVALLERAVALGPPGGQRPWCPCLEGHCPPDGSAGTAYESEHSAAA
jgi:60 kDa SS-A/Ro ribonucleoprotein